MALGSWEFVNNLGRAGVVGVAYGYAHSDEMNDDIPSVALVARDGDALRMAFDDFHAWAEKTDGDSLEVTFVFRQSGEYVLSLSHEPQRLIFRCLGYDRVHQPLTTFAAWSKQIDTTHPALRALKNYSDRFPAPLLLDGASTRITAPLELGTTAALDPIPGLKPLLKFRATFVDEDDVQPNTAAALALASVSPEQKGKKPSKEIPKRKLLSSPEEVSDRRREALRTHFPVTLERYARNAGVTELARRLEADHDVHAWQVEQALCNLTLSMDILGHPHFLNLKRKKVTDSVTQALKARYEVADGAAPHVFTREEVMTQIIADVGALLRCESKEVSISTIEAAQAAIRAKGMLDAPAVLLDPSSQDSSDQDMETV